MNEAFVNQYLDQSVAESLPAAEEHYRSLFDCFSATIPACLHRTGELAPSSTRPPGFNQFSKMYQFGVELGDGYASTIAVFKFKKRLGVWVSNGFMCHIQVTLAYVEQANADTLPAIILSAKEMWETHQKRLQEAQKSMPTGDSMVN